MQKAEYLECAVIRSTHGINGNVRLENRCNSPEVLSKLKRAFIKQGNDYIEYKITHSFVQKAMVCAHLEGIESVEDAAALRDVTLYAKREDFKLKKGETFIVDLLNLPVIDVKSGETLGILSDVIQPGAQQLYVVKREEGDFMIPVVPEFVKEISDGTEKTEGIYVDLIEGFLD